LSRPAIALRLAIGLSAAFIMATSAGRVGAEQPPTARDRDTAAERLRLALVPAEPIPLPPVADQATDGRLTLAEVEQLALAYHPALRDAEGQLRAARGNWLQVGLRPNPEIGYTGSEIGNEGAAGQQGGFVSQELVTAGKLGMARAVASREIAAAEQRLARTRLQVLTTARVAYFEVLAAERAVALAAQLKEIAQQAVRVSELRLRIADISRAALLQSQVEGESAALLEVQAVNRRAAAWRRLAAVIGLEGETPRPLDDALQRPLPELDWTSARERLLAASPELAELRFEVERARMAVARASAGRVPNVDVQAGVARDTANGDTIASVQVSMPVPIFDRNQGAIAQACGELAAAEAALEQRQLALEQRLATAFRDYQTARERLIRYAEAILPTARESLELINQGYEQGELEFLQVLTVQQTYTETNLAYLRDLESAWKEWAELEGLLVGVLPESSN
jgi:cobalt-zinc-cadmium efflux system outer membrane protein